MSRIHEELPQAVQTFSRVLAIHDALPERFKPSDATPLREILPGIWPTVADLRALVEWGASNPSPAPNVVVPTGYVLVPVKPTKEMAHEAACYFYGFKAVMQAGGIEGISMQNRNGDPTFWTAFKKLWKAALAHAPQPSDPSPAPSSRGPADIDQKALAVADDIVRQMMDKGALLAIRDNEGELVPMALDRQFQLKAGWQIAIAAALQPGLRVTNPATIAEFVGALADHGVKLPLLGTDEDVGTLTDADGKPVLVVDVNRERTDEDVAWIVSMIQVAVNTCGGFKAQRQERSEP